MSAAKYREIFHTLEKWAAHEPPLVDFTVSNVLSALKLDEDCYDEVFRYLFRMQGFELIPKLMMLCPHNHKDASFELERVEVREEGTVYKFAEEFDEDEAINCWVCNEEYFFDPDSAMIVFCFSEDFLQDAKKKILEDSPVEYDSSFDVELFLNKLVERGLVTFNGRKIIVNNYIDQSNRSVTFGAGSSGNQANTGDVHGTQTMTQSTQIGTERPLTDDIVEQIKKIIADHADLADPMKGAANVMAEQLKAEEDPNKRGQIFNSLKALVGPVVSGLLVEVVKGVAGFGA